MLDSRRFLRTSSSEITVCVEHVSSSCSGRKIKECWQWEKPWSEQELVRKCQLTEIGRQSEESLYQGIFKDDFKWLTWEAGLVGGSLTALGQLASERKNGSAVFKYLWPATAVEANQQLQEKVDKEQWAFHPSPSGPWDQQLKLVWDRISQHHQHLWKVQKS